MRRDALPIPLTSTTFWRVLMAFSRTGSTDCMIPSLLSISLIYGCIPSIAFIFLATSTSGCPSSSLLRILAVRAFWMFLIAAVLATADALSSLASAARALWRVYPRLATSLLVLWDSRLSIVSANSTLWWWWWCLARVSPIRATRQEYFIFINLLFLIILIYNIIR